MNTRKEPLDTRFAWVIGFLQKLIWDHGQRGGFRFGSALFNRLARTAVRFKSLHARLQADPARARATAPARAPRKPGVAAPVVAAPAPAGAVTPAPAGAVTPAPAGAVTPAPTPTPTPVPPAQPPLPRGFAWLHRPIPKIHVATGFVIGVINDPDYQAVLRTDYRYARILRPLCHMLGIQGMLLPDFLRAPRRQRVHRPKPPKTETGPKIPRAWLPPQRAAEPPTLSQPPLSQPPAWQPPAWQPPTEPQSHDPPIQQYWRGMGYR